MLQRRVGPEHALQIIRRAPQLRQGAIGLGQRVGNAFGQRIHAAGEFLAQRPVLVQRRPHGGKGVGDVWR